MERRQRGRPFRRLRLLLLGRCLRRRRFFLQLRRQRHHRRLSEAEWVLEFSVQGVGLALREGAAGSQGGGAGSGLPMPHVAQQRGALAVQLDVRRMVPNLSYPCSCQPEGYLCLLPHLPFHLIGLPRQHT